MNNFQNKKIKEYSCLQKKILDIEEKYFEILLKTFKGEQFSKDLNRIVVFINKHWDKIHNFWGKVNVIDLAIERIINFRIYTEKKLNIIDIYPSVISSDTAFITKDCVINIDSKTINILTNANDWKKQIVGSNQSSFRNKNYTSKKKKDIKITCLLETLYEEKPVLSFFLSILYFQDKKNKQDSWFCFDKDHSKINVPLTKKHENNIKFACLPNGELSNLYNNNIFCGIKSYDPPNHPNPKGTKSMRVEDSVLEKRVNSNGKRWNGLKSWKI